LPNTSEGFLVGSITSVSNAMSLACALKQRTIERATVVEALADLDLDSLIEKPSAVTGAPKEGPIQVTSAPQRLNRYTRRWFFKVGPPELLSPRLLVLAAGTGVNKGEVPAPIPSKPFTIPAAQQLPAIQNLTKPEVESSSVKQQPGSIRVSRGQTLIQICVETLGRIRSADSRRSP